MIQIRAMTSKDIDAVSRLLGASWRRTYAPIMGAETTALVSDERHAPQQLAEDLADPDKAAFVAERPDRSLAGYALASMDKTGDVRLDRLHLDPAEFGTGLATDLLHAVLAFHAGIPSIAVEVIEGNDRALGFYRKHGFEVVRHQAAAHEPDGHASIVLRKLLPRA